MTLEDLPLAPPDFCLLSTGVSISGAQTLLLPGLRQRSPASQGLLRGNPAGKQMNGMTVLLWVGCKAGGLGDLQPHASLPGRPWTSIEWENHTHPLTPND